jgi:hypothetical protein
VRQSSAMLRAGSPPPLNSVISMLYRT